MIEVIVSQGCPFCPRQVEAMASMDPSGYRIIHEGTKEFDEHELNQQVDGFPFLVIRGGDGEVLYAAAGYMDARQLDTKIARLSGRETPVFNLRKARSGN